MKFVQIPQDLNAEADEIARNASADPQGKSTEWNMEEQEFSSIEELQTLPVHTQSGWMDPILSFLSDAQLPSSLEEARKI